MDDWVFRRDLIEPARLKALSERSDVHGALQAASHFAAIGAAGTALHFAYGTLWAVPAFVLYGCILNFLYAGQHELIHRTVFRTRRLNDWVRQITGLLLIYPSGLDQKSHFQHHRHTKDPKRDSEAQNRVPIDFPTYAKRVLGLQFWVVRLANLYKGATGRFEPTFWYLTPEQRREVAFETRAYVAVYALVGALSIYFETWVAVSHWLAPMVLTKWTHQLHNLSEHSGLPNVADIARNTRTVKTNRFMRWLVWNMCFHADHHMFPGVPFYKLPELHAITGPISRWSSPATPRFIAASRAVSGANGGRAARRPRRRKILAISP